ncbi:bifunctional UDP-N-acetylglucosamine diphosphorylase/glucosamine-1-phosphate N-acetyltransferase GlmU [Uliginosibacterium sediminicola]|uniref:Bifunctional protein GlmU n=1 Tax=Uliginosibacterium sediminicola TaxID=2024550 RepID=A0ABU9YTJ0_9RHOO
MQVIILAAGQGKRMHSRLPKVLQPIAGQAMLKHVINTARALQPESICVVFGHGGDQVRAALPDADLAWAEQAQQLGTGHAVQQAMPHIADHGLALILYGDVPLTRADTLSGLVQASAGEHLALLTVTLEEPKGYGRIVRDDAGKVLAIVEEKDASPAQREICEVNTGILCVPVARLRGWLARLSNNNAQGEYYLTDIIAMAVADGVQVKTSQPAAVWETLGVNNKQQLAELERIHQRNIANRLLEGGVTLIDPARIDVRGELRCANDVEIDVGCIFEGTVELGEGVRIGAYCVLRNVSIAAGTQLSPFCHLDGAQVDTHCSIGPFARLRPGTQLGQDVHVGNFVEIKNSHLGDGTKAGHLAYVGDAEVGREVNIGAGVITANYDGVNKHRTLIGDQAFIGSDSQLIAPVSIGEGAFIAAGSTISRNAPEKELTLSRARQVTLPGWKRPVKKS